ncbi:MAG: SRPBCC family protein [Thermoleophilia bacterium]
MPGFRATGVCRAPALDVFAILHDPTRMEEWWADTARVETGPDGGVTRYAAAWPDFPYPLGVSGGDGAVTISCLVSDIVYEWRLAPHPDGCEVSARVELPDDQAEKLDAQRDEVDRSLGRLIALAEGRAPGGPPSPPGTP